MGTQDKLIADLYNVATILKNAELTEKGKLFHKDVLDFISNPNVYLLASNSKGDVSHGSILGYADWIIDKKILTRYISSAPRDDTVFEIYKEDSGSIKIRVCPLKKQRVIKNPDFASGADVQRLKSPATELECEPGTLMKTDDGYIVTKVPRILLK